MDNLLALAHMPDGSLGSLTIEEEFVKFVYDDLSDIKHKFVDIGFRLNEADNHKYYKRLGFDSIEQLAESLFGFKRSTTYNLIGICQRFAGGTMHLFSQFENYSQTQLVQMLPLSGKQLSYITPDMSVADISDLKHFMRSYTNFANTGMTAREMIDDYRSTLTANVHLNGQKKICIVCAGSLESYSYRSATGTLIDTCYFNYCPCCGRKL